jgi:hypothetical protein
MGRDERRVRGLKTMRFEKKKEEEVRWVHD